MKIKNKLKIGGIDLSVRKFKKLITTDDEEALGHSHEATAQIKLATHFEDMPVPECVMTATYFHEILHHSCWVAGVVLDEEEVTALGHVLFQVLRDNELDFSDKT